MISIKAPRRRDGQSRDMMARPAPCDPDPFERNAPRFVIHPSPDRFDAGVTQERFDAWAARLPEGAAIDLRIHVPFCRKLCWFCAFRAQGVGGPEAVEAYAEALAAEIARTGRLARGARVRAVGLAGGSPTELTEGALARVLEAVRAAFPTSGAFDIVSEVDAAAVGRARIDAFLRAGLTRGRLGVQDFAPAVQARIGRTQCAEATARVIGWLRKGGAAVDVELLYGLPGQTEESIAATCARLIGFEPDRVSLAGYIHAPRLAKRQNMIREADIPPAAARRAQHDRAAALLAEAGYRPVGVDLHVLPGDPLLSAATEGTLRRCQITGYAPAAAAAVFGIGAGAISRFAKGLAQNDIRTADWVAAALSGRGAVKRGVVLGLEDQLRARAIEMMVCSGALDVDALHREFGDFAALLYRAPAAASLRRGGAPADLALRAAMLLDAGRRRGPFSARAAVGV